MTLSRLLPVGTLPVGIEFTIPASPFPAARWVTMPPAGMNVRGADGTETFYAFSGQVVANAVGGEDWGSVVLDSETMVDVAYIVLTDEEVNSSTPDADDYVGPTFREWDEGQSEF